MSCAVVIPYYQREDGVLRRTLESVFAQSFQDFRVIVVDDASPHPAEDELAPLPEAQRVRVDVVKQTNKGPGGARNTGLDAAGDVTCVAFLDSDDIWDIDHLQRAVTALNAHAGDLYIANIGGEEGFEYHSGIETIEAKWPSTLISETPHVLEIDALHERMLSDWTWLHLSSTVMGPSLYKHVRFDESLRIAGEDLLFFFDCLRLSGRTLLCAAPGSVRGLGENIFHSVTSVSDNYIDQQLCFLRLFNMMQRRSGVSSDIMPMLNQHRENARLKMMWGQRGRIRQKKGAQISKVMSWLGHDPSYPFWLVGYMLGGRNSAAHAANSSS